MSLLSKALRFAGATAAESVIGGAGLRVGTAIGLKIGTKIFPPLVYILNKEGDAIAAHVGGVIEADEDEEDEPPPKRPPRRRA